MVAGQPAGSMAAGPLLVNRLSTFVLFDRGLPVVLSAQMKPAGAPTSGGQARRVVPANGLRAGYGRSGGDYNDPDRAAASRCQEPAPGLSLRAVITGTVVAAFGVGLALRLWLLWHRPLTSDEAIVGLMASQIRHGQMFTFFWGQSYGGVEPYVVALWSFVAGSGAASLNSVPMVLSAVAAVLAWRIGLRVVPAGMKVLAVAAGAVLWVWPDVVIYNSTRELGFRGVTVVTGLAVLLMALRVIERPSPFNIGVLGLVAGIGWWSSPEILYFAVPAVAYLLFSQRELRSAPRWRLLLLPAGFVIGPAPWLATNLRTGFLSLRASSSPTTRTPPTPEDCRSSSTRPSR